MRPSKRPKAGFYWSNAAREEWQRFIDKFFSLEIEERFNWDVLREEFRKFLASCRSSKAIQAKIKLKDGHVRASASEEFFKRTGNLKKNPPIRTDEPK